METKIAGEDRWKIVKPKVRVLNGDKKIHGINCSCMICPSCGATEVNDCTKPITEWKWQIKPFKVDMHSHCLQCDTWF